MSGAVADAALQDARPPLGRLTLVELRKLADTRAGGWMLAIVALVLVAVAVVFAFAAPEEEQVFQDLFAALQVPMAIMLPILGILLVSSEWSQRTALTTFTLVPARLRVVAAKAIAVALVATVAVAVAAAAAALGILAAGGDWTLDPDTLPEVGVLQLTGMLGGLAFGLAFQASAPAIVAYLVLPTIVSIIVGVVDAIRDVARWIDMGQATIPFGEGAATATEWARLGTATCVWVVVPLAIGIWRLSRSDFA